MNRRNTFLLLSIALLSVLVLTGRSYAVQGCGHDCSKCHSITLDEAQKVVSAHGAMKVKDVRVSPVKGLWQVLVEHDRKVGVLYMDFEKKHIIYGAVVKASSQDNLTKKTLEGSFRVDISGIRLDEALTLGNEKAGTKVIVFTDPACEYCAKLHAEIKKVLKKRNDLLFYIVLYPLKKLHPSSYETAQAIQCGKSLKLLEAAYAGKKLPAAGCRSKVVDDNIAFAEKYGISGTPTIIFPNGTIHFGYLKAEEFLNKILRNAGKE